MTVEEIARALGEARSLPLEGRQRLERLERLAEHARACPSRKLESDVLVTLVHAHEYSAERARLPVHIGRLLQILEAHGAEIPGLERTVYWDLKWMTSALINNPAVPVPTVLRWMEELERRYRERGISLRPAHGLRGQLAQTAGDQEAAARHFEELVAAVRDGYADCHACESNALGDWRAWAGDDAGALRYWAPVLDGEQTCASEPHATLGQALLPLVREGKADEARSAHLKGYPMVRRIDSLRGPVGCHIEFCALTGNEGRGLEILAEHAAWLTAAGEDPRVRLEFLSGAVVLLRRLAALGLADLPLAEGTVGSVLAAAEPEAFELAGRFDTRFGNTHRTAALAARFDAEPLLERLPLGSRGSTVPVAVRTPAAPVPPDAFEELLAEARGLSELNHPGAGRAWRRVATRGGPEPTPEIRLELLRTDDESAPEAVAEGLAALLPDLAELPVLRLRALATRAMALLRAGDPEGSDAAHAVAAEADAAWKDGVLTAPLYLEVRRAVPFTAFVEMREEDPESVARASAAAEAEKALAEELAVAARAAHYAELLGRIRLRAGDHDGSGPHLAEARERYVATGRYWLLPMPTHFLAGQAANAGDAARAEALLRETLRLAGPALGPDELAPLASHLVEILAPQQGRAADLVDAALEAARLWEGVHEPDHVHNVCNAARGYLALDRCGEAVGLFEQVADRFEVSYEGGSLAFTRRQYGLALRETGDHRRAAEQFLAGAATAAEAEDGTELQAELAWYAGDELGGAGLVEESGAAYRRAAALWEELGALGPRVMCLRAAAWVDHELDGSPDPGASDAVGPAAMRAVLALVEEVAAAEPSDAVDELLTGTREQLAAMLTTPEGAAG
ncbi:hypothetical protein GCM10022221_39060 [Actinocorallia aurea]